MSHLFFFGPQVGKGVWRSGGLAGNPSDNLDASVRQGAHLARIIRQKANPPDTEIA